MARFAALLVLVGLVAAAASPAAWALDGPKRVNVVLLGATGNLAKKYLWKSLIHIELSGGVTDKNKEGGSPFEIHVWPAATRSKEQGQPVVDEFVSNAAEAMCGGLDSQSRSTRECEVWKSTRVHEYSKLRGAEDFQALHQRIVMDGEQSGTEEAGRLFYLSVPPRFYANIAQSIDEQARPAPRRKGKAALDSSKKAEPWLRVIFEKPFGRDEASARELAAKLTERLEEREIFRVDHYMGKAGVRAIPDFRRSFPNLERLLSKDRYVLF